LRSAAEAAAALGCSVGRYYQLEQRALKALVAGCEPRPAGRQPSADAELERLRRDNTRLAREGQRQPALVRVGRPAGRAAGPRAKAAPGKRRQRKKVARGQQAAARLRQAAEAAEAAPVGPGPEAAG